LNRSLCPLAPVLNISLDDAENLGQAGEFLHALAQWVVRMERICASAQNKQKREICRNHLSESLKNLKNILIQQQSSLKSAQIRAEEAEARVAAMQKESKLMIKENRQKANEMIKQLLNREADSLASSAKMRAELLQIRVKEAAHFAVETQGSLDIQAIEQLSKNSVKEVRHLKLRMEKMTTISKMNKQRLRSLWAAYQEQTNQLLQAERERQDLSWELKVVNEELDAQRKLVETHSQTHSRNSSCTLSLADTASQAMLEDVNQDEQLVDPVPNDFWSWYEHCFSEEGNASKMTSPQKSKSKMANLRGCKRKIIKLSPLPLRGISNKRQETKSTTPAPGSTSPTVRIKPPQPRLGHQLRSSQDFRSKSNTPQRRGSAWSLNEPEDHSVQQKLSKSIKNLLVAMQSLMPSNFKDTWLQSQSDTNQTARTPEKCTIEAASVCTEEIRLSPCSEVPSSPSATEKVLGLLWSDLGGRGDTLTPKLPEATAEFAEETLGALENMDTSPERLSTCGQKVLEVLSMEERSDKDVFQVSNGQYVMFIAPVRYVDDMMRKFSQERNVTQEEDLPVAEKLDLTWVPANTLLALMDTNTKAKSQLAGSTVKEEELNCTL